MSTATLAIDYATSPVATPWVNLEQLPVADNSLGLKDLARMLTLVRSGVSAHAYRQPSCPCSIYEGTVEVPLEFYAWPSAPGLPYELQAPQGDLVLFEAVFIEREFSVVIAFNKEIDLPFYADALSWAWADMPCFDRMGNEVARPHVVVTATRVYVAAEVLGAIRIQCVAVGHRHTLLLTYQKTIGAKVSSNTPQVSATWGKDLTKTLSLSLPGCVSDLLASCDDGTLVAEAANGGEVQQDSEKVAILYYNTCTGKAFPVQYGRP